MNQAKLNADELFEQARRFIHEQDQVFAALLEAFAELGTTLLPVPKAALELDEPVFIRTQAADPPPHFAIKC